jgi:hypothetical protein
MYYNIKLNDGCTFRGIIIRHFKVVGIKTYPNQAKFIGFYFNNKRHGYGIKQHTNKKLKLVRYKQGIKVL